MIEIVYDDTAVFLDSAAQIWAEATSARDGDEAIPPLEQSRPVIQRVVQSSPEAFLLIARHNKSHAVGFAAIAPVSDEAAVRKTAELHYLAVSPAYWGQGVGAALLTDVSKVLKARGFQQALLRVYCDNAKAVTLYKTSGWQSAGDPSAHVTSGKQEETFCIVL